MPLPTGTSRVSLRPRELTPDGGPRHVVTAIPAGMALGPHGAAVHHPPRGPGAIPALVHALVVLPQDEDDAYGIVSEADIAYKVIGPAKDPKAVNVGDIMTKPCVVINPDLGVEYVARLFANLHIHKAPVIQEKLLGIVSVSDILRRAM